MDDGSIDTLLASDRGMTPRPDFPHDVMRAVRQMDAPAHQVPFPWRSVALASAVVWGGTIVLATSSLPAVASTVALVGAADPTGICLWIGAGLLLTVAGWILSPLLAEMMG